MFSTIEALVARVTTWHGIALVVLMIMCIQGFAWRQKELGPTPTHVILDARFWYSPAKAQTFFGAIEKRGRMLYGITQLTLDVVFPVTYGLLFACLIFQLQGAKANWLLGVPLLAAGVDLLENVSTAYLAFSFDGTESSLTWFAASCTATKTVLFSFSLLLICYGLIKTLFV